MNYWARFKFIARPLKQALSAGVDNLYDYYRFLRFGGWRRNYSNRRMREYRATKMYHSLEKSLSFPVRKPGSGWAVAGDLTDLLKYSDATDNAGFQDIVAADVIKKFVKAATPFELAEQSSRVRAIRENNFIAKSPSKYGGTSAIIQRDMISLLSSPDEFFRSRRTVRNFAQKNVQREHLEKAVDLARSTPSACNRQPWHTYIWLEPEKIEQLIKEQKGLRGLENTVPSLLLVASDIGAFDSAGERFQQWIDGGMFAMTLVWALHSLGLSSCCLNWSRGAIDDIKFRKISGIENHHTIIMLIAVGYPADDSLGCASERRPLTEIITYPSLGNKEK